LKIIIKKKKIKNIYLRVDEDKVIISAPYGVSDDYIKKFIEKKKEWIKKRVKSGDFEYLGKNYTLKSKKGEKFKITFHNNFVEVEYKKDLKKELQNWQKERAREIFGDIIDKYSKEIEQYPKKVRITKAKSRWGSCNFKKRYINLSLYLLKKPIEAIEYVILHELAHLVYPNHSKDFYDFIKKYMRDYKKREEMLR
jgi:predicted metal-dependent hydrolase